MEPTVAVVIPTQNRSDSLGVAIQSVFNQTRLPNELIVVDDGSREAVSESVFVGAPEGVECTILRNEEPIGAAAARNRGIRAAKSDWIAFLDDDDEWLPVKLAKQAPLFSGPEVGLVCSGLEIIYPELGARYVSFPSVKGYCFPEMLIENRIGGTVSVVLRADVAKAELFDPAMPARQDYDLWLRVTRRWNVAAVLEPLVRVYARSAGRITSDIGNYEAAIEKINQKLISEVERLSADQQAYRMAEQNFFLGSQAVKANNIAKARYYYRKSLRYRPTPKALAALVASFFGIRGVVWLRGLKAGA